MPDDAAMAALTARLEDLKESIDGLCEDVQKLIADQATASARIDGMRDDLKRAYSRIERIERGGQPDPDRIAASVRAESEREHAREDLARRVSALEATRTAVRSSAWDLVKFVAAAAGGGSIPLLAEWLKHILGGP